MLSININVQEYSVCNFRLYFFFLLNLHQKRQKFTVDGRQSMKMVEIVSTKKNTPSIFNQTDTEDKLCVTFDDYILFSLHKYIGA